MYSQTLTDATDLNHWSNRNEAATILPRLVRRLISVTAHDIVQISVRAGDGVSIGGWDGCLEATEGNEFVPKGKSVWEIGKDKNVKGKADGDYEKRKAGMFPAGEMLTNIVVFVANLIIGITVQVCSPILSPLI